MTDKKPELNDESQEPRIYEIGYLLIPNLTSEEVTDSVNSIRDLAEGAGEIITSENPKLIKLAYAMEKTKDHKKHTFEEGHFGWMKFRGAPEKLGSIKNSLDENDNIIRFLIAKAIAEDTRVPKRPAVSRKPKPAEAAKPSKPISEAELDKAIDELVESN